MDVQDLQNSLKKHTLNMMQVIQTLFKDMTRNTDLTYPQFMLMKTIQSHQQLTIGQIVKCTELDQGNISNLCKKLEKKGWLHRQRNPMDEREVFVSVSQQGEDLLRGLDKYFEKLFEEVLQIIGNEKIEQIIGSVGEFVECFQDVMKKD